MAASQLLTVAQAWLALLSAGEAQAQQAALQQQLLQLQLALQEAMEPLQQQYAQEPAQPMQVMAEAVVQAPGRLLLPGAVLQQAVQQEVAPLQAQLQGMQLVTVTEAARPAAQQLQQAMQQAIAPMQQAAAQALAAAQVVQAVAPLQQQFAALQQQFATLQQQSTALQQQFAARQQQLAILLNRTSTPLRMALQHNGFSTQPEHSLFPVPHPDTGALPPDFPATNNGEQWAADASCMLHCLLLPCVPAQQRTHLAAAPDTGLPISAGCSTSLRCLPRLFTMPPTKPPAICTGTCACLQTLRRWTRRAWGRCCSFMASLWTAPGWPSATASRPSSGSTSADCCAQCGAAAAVQQGISVNGACWRPAMWVIAFSPCRLSIVPPAVAPDWETAQV